MSGVVLSICIGTLNRAQFIGATLDTIVPHLSSDVELVVVDGASSDATGEILAVYVAQSPHVRYFRETTNSGFDRDFDKAVSYAQGRYCWLLGDDDLVKPGAIARVLAECRADYALIVVNAEVWSKDLTRCLHPTRLLVSGMKRYERGDIAPLFRDTVDALSFIGATVIRRDLWLERQRQPYFGTWFVHVGVIFQAPLPGPVLLIGDPLVKIRYGNAQWTSRAFEIWMIKWPQLLWSFGDVPEPVRAHVLPRQPWRDLKTLFLMRGKGAYTFSDFKTWIWPNVTLGAAAGPGLIAVLPAVAVNLACIGYLRAFGRAPGPALVDLYQSRHWIGRRLTWFSP